MRSTEEIEDAVRSCLLWLEKNEPGARNRIDWDLLDMSAGEFPDDQHGCGCVGAQLARDGDYWTFAEDHNLGLEEAISMGLMHSSEADEDEMQSELESMTRIWKQLGPERDETIPTDF